jgi:2-keto-3-deoxy-galactonokinase
LSHCPGKEKAGEKALEAKLRKAVEARGGMALKLLSQFHRGLPDRLILMPGGHTYFAEIKTTGKKPTRLQKHCHALLRKLGFQVFVIDSTDSLETALALMARAVIAERIKREEFEL